MEYLVTFIITFIFIFTIYYFYYIKSCERGKKCPTEATYLIKLYGLNVDKFSYRKFMFFMSLTSSLDVAIVTTIVYAFDKIVWQILFGIVVVIPVIVISFIIIGKYYQNKQLKDNSKELMKEKKYLDKLKKKKSKLKRKGRNK